jgi:hypothetical protein
VRLTACRLLSGDIVPPSVQRMIFNLLGFGLTRGWG